MLNLTSLSTYTSRTVNGADTVEVVVVGALVETTVDGTRLETRDSSALRCAPFSIRITRHSHPLPSQNTNPVCTRRNLDRAFIVLPARLGDTHHSVSMETRHLASGSDVELVSFAARR